MCLRDRTLGLGFGWDRPKVPGSSLAHAICLSLSRTYPRKHFPKIFCALHEYRYVCRMNPDTGNVSRNVIGCELEISFFENEKNKICLLPPSLHNSLQEENLTLNGSWKRNVKTRIKGDKEDNPVRLFSPESFTSFQLFGVLNFECQNVIPMESHSGRLTKNDILISNRSQKDQHWCLLLGQSLRKKSGVKMAPAWSRFFERCHSGGWSWVTDHETAPGMEPLWLYLFLGDIAKT